MSMVPTRIQAAAELGITERQLGNWANEPWFPPAGHTKDGWNVEVILAAQHVMGRKGSGHSDTAKKLKLALDNEKLKKQQLETQMKTLDLQLKEGALLPRRGWELFAATLLTNLGDAADQLPDLIRGICCRKCAKKIAKRLKQELDNMRNNTADELQAGPQNLEVA